MCVYCNVCNYVQTLNMLFWLNAVVSLRNVIKKLQNCFFFFQLSTFSHFLGMTPQKACRNYLSAKSTFKAAQKLTPSQFCSKDALNEAIFPKNGNFGTRATAVSFLSCFSHETQISF